MRAQSYTSTSAATAWSASRWNSTDAAPYTSVYTANNAVSFTSGTYTFAGMGATTNVGNVTVASGVTVNFASIGSTFATNGAVRTFDIGSGGLFDFNSQTISAVAGTGFIKTGAGVFATGSCGVLTGGFTLNNGTVIIRGTTGLGNGTGSFLTLNGGTVASNATRSIDNTRLPVGITIGGNVQFGEMSTVVSLAHSTADLSFANNISLGSSLRTLTLGNGGITTFSGVISGSGGLIFAANVNGTGSFALATNNTYTGKTQLTGGIVSGSGESIFGGNPGSFVADQITFNGGTLSAAGNIGFSSNRGITFTGSSNTINTNANIVTLTNVATGAGGYTKTGSGSLILAGAHTYTGATTVSAGVLQLNAAGTFPDASALSLAASTTFDLKGFSETIGSLAGAGGTVTSTAAGTLTLTTGGDNTSTTYAGIVQNGTATSVSLTKVGNGTLTLSGGNTYTGTTTITAGTLRLGAGNVIANTSNMVLNGGTFSTGATTGFTETVGTLDVNANSTIALGTGVHTLTFANSSAVTWSGTTLTITGWTGTAGASGTAGKIVVGASGLTASQLAKINFSGYSNGAVIVSGEVVPVSITAPTVTSSAATTITTIDAILNGDVTSDGGSTVTERGFVYKTSAGATINDNKTIVSGTTGAFTLTPTLSVNTQYFFKAYAINSINTTLSTPELSFYTLANAPNAPTVNNSTATTLDITINANSNPSATEFAIQETGGNYVQANGSLSGSTIWQTAATWGTKTVTGLSPNTSYTFKVKARNGANTETAFGSTASNTTSATVSPTISASASVGGAVSTTYGTASVTPTSFTVSGATMNAGIKVTPPLGFEVCLASDFSTTIGTNASPLTFGVAGTILSTTVYVRLPATATVANSPYSGNIELTSTGANSPNVATVSSTVTAKSLTITGLTGVGKVYDATTTATVTGTATYNGLANSESFSVTGTPSFVFASKAIGLRAITASNYTAPSSNYILTSQPTVSSATITAATLTITSPTATNRAYNTTTNVTVGGNLNGVLLSDAVTLNATGTVATADVGTSKTVTFSISGADAGNYILTQPSPSTTVDIIKADQTITFGALASKTTASAAFALTATSSSGLAVTYTSSNLAVATISSGTVIIQGAGNTTITASQAGDGNYNAATAVTQTQTVNQAPVITATPTSLAAFSTTAGTASIAQGFTVTGSNLIEDILVTAPTGFEVSQTAGGASGYNTTQILTQSSGAVSKVVYVRLTTSATGTPSGNVALTSTSSSTVNIAVNGTVNVVQSTIANWTFETNNFAGTATTTGSLSPETGSGTFACVHASNSSYSAPAGNGSSKSQSSNTWTTGDYYQFLVSTIGKTNINISWDQTGSNTGPKNFKLQYSLTGSGFQDMSGGAYTVNNTAGSWSSSTLVSGNSYSYDLSSITTLNNASSVYFRLAVVDMTAISGTFASAGTNRVDNVLITASTPST
ncbi:MAG: YDG domain-containing protein, partial [Flavobacteriia bacterium]